MDIFILELVSNQLAIPVKIAGGGGGGGGATAGRNIGAIENRGPMYIATRIKRGMPPWKTCEAGWRCALWIYSS